jgi:hypothetical protein
MCSTSGTRFNVIDRRGGSLLITDAAPNSRACVANFAEQFHPVEVNADGTVVVPESSDPVFSGLGGRRDTVYQAQDGEWVLLVEVPPPGTPEAALDPLQSWLGSPAGDRIRLWALVTLVAVSATAVAVDNALVARRRRRALARTS